MFLWAGVWFHCFPFAGLFPALQRCQGAPLLCASVFVFPESGAPTGGSSPGQLQMRNSWPTALAATQIRPFEKITVLLLPPPPVGHARSAEGRGMCRRAGSGRGRRGEGGTGGPHFIRPLSESFSHYFSSPCPPQMFQFLLHKTGHGLFPNKTWQGFFTQLRALWHSPHQQPPHLGCLLAGCFCFLGNSDEWSIDSVKAHCGTAAGYLC